MLCHSIFQAVMHVFWRSVLLRLNSWFSWQSQESITLDSPLLHNHQKLLACSLRFFIIIIYSIPYFSPAWCAIYNDKKYPAYSLLIFESLIAVLYEQICAGCRAILTLFDQANSAPVVAAGSRRYCGGGLMKWLWNSIYAVIPLQELQVKPLISPTRYLGHFKNLILWK